MSELAMLNDSHLAAGTLLLGLILYFFWRNRVRRDQIELQRKIDGKTIGGPVDTRNYDLRTRTRGSRSWIS